MKLKLNPFGLGLLDPSRSHTTSLTSPYVKLDIRHKLSSSDRDMK